MDNGPEIKISSNFVVKGQKIEARNLKQIAKTDPIFGCSFWPSVLKQIFQGAIDNIELEWSQDWLRLANKLYPGHLEIDRNNNLKPIDGKDAFSEVITHLIDKWIEEKGFDISLFKSVYEDGYARKGTATTSSEEKGTGRDSTVRLGKLYKRLNIAYIGPLLTPQELADTLGPGFEI